jgi:hypothetical protein
MTRRDDREYREYLREEQRSQRGCIARRMQPDFHHGLLNPWRLFAAYPGKTPSAPAVVCGENAKQFRISQFFDNATGLQREG